MATDIKYLVFAVGPKEYAIRASVVREIVTGLPRFPVPFVPRWVLGVVNRHGEPYALLDLQCLLGGDPLDAKTAILLNVEGDRIALNVSDVIEFRSVAEGALHSISSPDEETAFFQGALPRDGGDSFVLDVAHVLRRLAEDVRNV